MVAVTLLLSYRQFSRVFSQRNIMRKLFVLFGLAAALTLSGCGYNDFQSKDEAVKKAWAEVLNQYQRRADLIPINMTAEALTNPQAVKNFQAAQGELSSALSRLLVVSENYPQLKSDANFRDLQSQLEGTENRITVARKRFTESVEGYNVLTRQFPTNLTAMIFGYKVKEQFTVENEKAIAVPPKVNFGTTPAPAAPAPAAPATTAPAAAPAPAATK